MKQANSQNQFQQGNNHSVGNINQINPMIRLPHNSLHEINVEERMGGSGVETVFRPTRLVEVEINVDYKSQNPNKPCLKPEPLEHTMEDFLSLVEQQGFVDGYVDISHGSEVEERSGSKTNRNSYYYQDKSDGTVMTIESDNVTAETIRETSDKLIEQLHNNNLL